MKKKFLTLAFLASTTVALASCGGNSGGGSGTVEGGIIDTPTTIYLWTTAGDEGQANLNRWVEDFKEIEPNVTVVNNKVSGGYDDLENMIITGFTGNNYPDLAYAYPDNVSNYIDYGRAVQLDDYINHPEYGLTEEEFNDYVPSYMEEGTQYTVEGTWSVPFSKSTEGMFYNADILIGLDLSEVDSSINSGNPLNEAYLNNLTWEEFFGKLAPALLKYDAEVRDIIQPQDDGVTRVLGYDSDDNLFITLAHQYGYPYTSVTEDGKGSIDFNTPEMKAKLQEFAKYYEKGYIFTKGTNEGNYVNEKFTVNQCLFSVGSTGGIKYQFSDSNPMNVGVAKIPQADGGTPSTILQGPSMCILDHGDENRKLASWLFYKYITTPENTLQWALNSTGYYPIRLSNLEDPAYLAAADADAQQDKSMEKLTANGFVYYGTMTDTLFTSPAFKGSSTARTQVGGLLTQVLLQGDAADIDQLFADAEAMCNLAL